MPYILYEKVEKMEGIGDDLIKQELLDHYETNKSSRVYCDECDYATTNPTSLIRHKASKHKIKKQERQKKKIISVLIFFMEFI